MSDFSNIVEIAAVFAAIVEDSEVDFENIGDGGLIVITEETGFGDGGFGDGPFGGGRTTVTIGSAPTVWTNIETP
jgi:hypothetical protein